MPNFPQSRRILGYHGRYIGIRGDALPSFVEIFRALGNMPGTHGHGKYETYKWNLLKRAVLRSYYGCLGDPRGFIRYLLNDWYKVILGDKPEVFKTPADCEAQNTAIKEYRDFLLKTFPDFDRRSVGIWDTCEMHVDLAERFVMAVEYQFTAKHINRDYFVTHFDHDEFQHWTKFLSEDFDYKNAVDICYRMLNIENVELVNHLKNLVPRTFKCQQSGIGLISKFFSKHLNRSIK